MPLNKIYDLILCQVFVKSFDVRHKIVLSLKGVKAFWTVCLSTLPPELNVCSMNSSGVSVELV